MRRGVHCSFCLWFSWASVPWCVLWGVGRVDQEGQAGEGEVMWKSSQLSCPSYLLPETSQHKEISRQNCGAIEVPQKSRGQSLIYARYKWLNSESRVPLPTELGKHLKCCSDLPCDLGNGIGVCVEMVRGGSVPSPILPCFWGPALKGSRAPCRF